MRGVVLLRLGRVDGAQRAGGLHAPVAVLVREPVDEVLARRADEQAARLEVEHVVDGLNAGLGRVGYLRHGGNAGLLEALPGRDALPRIPLVGGVDGRRHGAGGVPAPQHGDEHAVEEVLEALVLGVELVEDAPLAVLVLEHHHGRVDARLVHADDYLVEHEGLQRVRSDVALRGERREDGLALHHGDVEHAVLVLDDVGAPGLEQGLDLVAVVPHPPLLGGEVVGVSLLAGAEVPQVLRLGIDLVDGPAIRAVDLERGRGLAQHEPVWLGLLAVAVEPRTMGGLVEVHDDPAPVHTAEVLRREAPDTGLDGGEDLLTDAGGLVDPREGPVGRQDLGAVVGRLEGEEVELEAHLGAVLQRDDVDAAQGRHRAGDVAALGREHLQERLAGHGRELGVGRAHHADARVPHAVRRGGLGAGVEQDVHGAAARLARAVRSAEHLHVLVGLVEGEPGGGGDVSEHYCAAS